MAVNNAQIVIQNGQVTTYVQPNIALISINQGSFSGGGGAVSSVTGTVNQITASPTIGAVVLTLPSFVQFPGTWAEGTLSYSDTGILWSAQSSTNSYNQVIVQNTNSGNTASANYIVSNDQGTATTFFGEFGMNSSAFAGTGAFKQPNYVYLDSTSADLAIGTMTNNAIHFVVNNSNTDTLTISGTGSISIPAFNTNNLIKTTGLTGTLALAVAGTDYLAPSGSGSSLSGVWLLASGGTLTGANTITGTSTNTIKFAFGNLGTTQTDGAGLYLQNPTAAASGLQQISPAITWEGQGWATTPVASQTVKFITDVLPVQGAANPTMKWRLRGSVNGSAYTDYLVMDQTTNLLTLGSNGGGINTPTNHLQFYTTGILRATIFATGSPGAGSMAIGTAGSAVAWLYLNEPASAAGAFPVLRADAGAHTNITASTEAISVDFRGATQTWATGTLATQRFNYFRGYTVAFVGSSTATDVYNLYSDGVTAGTNATITRGWSAGFGANVSVQGQLMVAPSGTSFTNANEFLQIRKDQNNVVFASIINTTSNTAASASLVLSNSSTLATNFQLLALSAGYTTSGILVANTAVNYSNLTGGLNVGTQNSSQLGLWTNNSERARFTPSTGNYLIGSTTDNARLYVVQSALSSAWVPVYRSDPGAHTALTAATEFISRDFQGATQTWVDGTTTTQRFNYFRGYTANKTTTSATFTDIYNVYIEPSTAGSGVTFTRNWALGLNGALQLFAGTTSMPPLVFQAGVNSTTIINGAVEFDGTHFYGAISGSRVQLDNQVAANGWLANGATTITGNTSQSGAFSETMNFNNVTIQQNVVSGIVAPNALSVETNAHTTLTGANANVTTLAVNIGVKTIGFNTGFGATNIATTTLGGGNTYTMVSGPVTLTDAINVFISGVARAGSGTVFTNVHGLLIGTATTSGTVTNSYGLSVNAQTGATNNYSAQFIGGIGVKFSQSAQSTTHNFIDIAQSTHTGSSAAVIGIKYVGGLHTNISGSSVDVSFRFDRTIQYATGSYGSIGSFLITAPALSFVAASTLIDAYTVNIGGAPSGSTNASITNSSALYISAGLLGSGVTNGYGLKCVAPTGATNNYSAVFSAGLGVQLNHLIGNTSAPSIAAGTGAGTTPTVSVSGTDLAGVITITTGTGTPAATAIIATITFNATYGSAPRVIIYPANRAARDLAIGAWPIVPANGQTNGVTTTTFVLESGTSLAATTTYLWTFQVIQ